MIHTQRMVIAVFLLAGTIACGVTPTTTGTETPPSTTGGLAPTEFISTLVPGPTTPIAGSWDAVRENFTGSTCMTNTYQVTSNPQSTGTIQMEKQVDSASVSSSLGVSVSAKSRIGLFDGDVKAQYARSSVSNDLSITTYYRARFDTALVSLDPYHYGYFVDPANPQWYSFCGDQFVGARHLGGEIWLRYSISFDTLATKQAFAADARISYGATTISASVQAAAASYMGKAWVKVDALQIGGDVTHLSNIVGGTDGGIRAFLDCSIDNMSACTQFMQKGIDYATNLNPGGFIDGVNRLPADLAYDLTRYDTAYVAGATTTPPPYRVIPPEIDAARASLQQLLDANLALYDRINQLQGVGAGCVNTALGSQLTGFLNQTKNNIAALKTVWPSCWDTLNLQDPASVAYCVAAPGMGRLAPLGYASGITLPQLQTATRIPVNRLYKSGYHLYSLTTNEGASLGYRLEIANNFYLEKSSRDGSVPFYRCFLGSGRHLMTTSASCEGAGTNEGSFGYIMTSQIDGAVPLYRWYKTGGDRLVTTTSSQPASGWRYEGISGYVWLAP